MDETAPSRGADADTGEPGRTGADRLVARLAELRGQLELLAPEDQERGREAIQRIREAQERIGALDAMLTAARHREHDLSLQTIRDRALITGYEARIAELSTIATRVSEAEEARRAAEESLAERERSLTTYRAEAEALRVEAARLRSRCADLEADVEAVARQAASATIARAKAARLERERNEARERAHTERHLAASDRIRAAEAESRVAELQGQLRAAERRVAHLERGMQARLPLQSGPEAAAPPEPPWIELQRTSSGSPPDESKPATAAPLEQVARADPGTEPLAPGSEPTGAETRVIDLTDDDDDPKRTEGDDAEGGASEASTEAWSASSGESFLNRFLHGRRQE